jgi:hypothetical protein
MANAAPINRLELEHFRLKATILALKAMMRTMCGLFASCSPVHEQALHEAFARMRLTNAKLVLNELDPASSDMVASEYQAIMESLLVFIENGLVHDAPALDVAHNPPA